MNRASLSLPSNSSITGMRMRVSLQAAVTTTELDCQCWYYDASAAQKVGFEDYQSTLNRVKTTGTTPVTLCPAATLNTVTRYVSLIMINNRDTVAATVIIDTYDASATSPVAYRLIKQSLAVDETLIISAEGWVSIV